MAFSLDDLELEISKTFKACAEQPVGVVDQELGQKAKDLANEMIGSKENYEAMQAMFPDASKLTDQQKANINNNVEALNECAVKNMLPP